MKKWMLGLVMVLVTSHNVLAFSFIKIEIGRPKEQIPVCSYDKGNIINKNMCIEDTVAEAFSAKDFSNVKDAKILAKLEETKKNAYADIEKIPSRVIANPPTLGAENVKVMINIINNNIEGLFMRFDADDSEKIYPGT